ncbi:chromatin assembly factor 1 subunit A-domain-containing protein [Sporodiniella umbellata]|nr:chromatin assembly factor 1 subunit A-domain-containing protein [Sporodiniella umbellata]
MSLLQRLDSFPQPAVPPLFIPFQTTDYTTLAPLISFQPEPIASNFTTLIYAGLDPTIDLKHRFFQSLSGQAKAKRGYKLNLDIHQAIQHNTTETLDGLRMKLLLFHEDVRQPYYGTCSMTSQDIGGRTPFGQDKQLLDYEEDSELEWDHDVDIEDIHDLMLSSPIAFDPSTSEEEEEEEEEEEGKREDRWIVPDGCLTDSPRKGFVVSRPAQRPHASPTHFMQPIVLGPSFESMQEYENHPLSDSKLHRIEEHPVEGCTLFEQVCMDKEEDEDAKDMISTQPLAAVYDEGEKNEFQRLSKEDQDKLILAIQENQSKSLMHMMNSIRSKKILMDYSSDQLQAIIYEIAAPEVRGNSKEYMWYLKPAIQ